MEFGRTKKCFQNIFKSLPRFEPVILFLCLCFFVSFFREKNPKTRMLAGCYPQLAKAEKQLSYILSDSIGKCSRSKERWIHIPGTWSQKSFELSNVSIWALVCCLYSWVIVTYLSSHSVLDLEVVLGQYLKHDLSGTSRVRLTLQLTNICKMQLCKENWLWWPNYMSNLYL